MLKRPSMDIYEQSQFYVFANPVVSSDNTSVLYDGFTTFVNGTSTFTFMMVDGIVYFSMSTAGDARNAQCLSASLLPPIHDIIVALNDAIAISSAACGSDTITCPSGDLFQATFGDATFIICASGSVGFTIYGSDLDISVEYLNSPVTITAPKLSDEAMLSCEKVAAPTSVSLTTLALLTGQPISSSSRRNLQSRRSTRLPAPSCSCKSTPRACIFFHGLGSITERTTLQSSSDYFGDLSKNAPCCSSIKYAVLNTVAVPWTDATLQQKVCNFAIFVSSTSSSSTRNIADTIIVTHSMGGLMMAGALANGRCTFAASTTWVSLSAPMTGSMGSDYLQDACSGSNVFLQGVANLVGQCPASNAVKMLAYENETRSTSALNAAYVAARNAFQANVDAAMCSNDFSGLFSLDQALYKLAGSVIRHKSNQNDGVVESQSCAGGIALSRFGTTYNNPFYLTRLNHADTAFRHGDGLFANSQKPVKWFECLL
ncbi:unnamed protein product [Peronospora effusa]|nr:unnamed protein product [Peronospora effusa]